MPPFNVTLFGILNCVLATPLKLSVPPVLIVTGPVPRTPTEAAAPEVGSLIAVPPPAMTVPALIVVPPE